MKRLTILTLATIMLLSACGGAVEIGYEQIPIDPPEQPEYFPYGGEIPEDVPPPQIVGDWRDRIFALEDIVLACYGRTDEELEQMFYDQERIEWRYTYHIIDGIFSDLVDDHEAVDAWFRANNPSITGDWHTKPLAAFVQHFNISREDFIAALELKIAITECQWSRGFGAHGEGPGCWTWEFYELPDPDVIFTFDHALISAHYRRCQDYQGDDDTQCVT